MNTNSLGQLINLKNTKLLKICRLITEKTENGSKQIIILSFDSISSKFEEKIWVGNQDKKISSKM